MQIGVDLAQVARVSLATWVRLATRVSRATRGWLRWRAPRILGRDVHWWLTRTGLDSSRLGPRLVQGTVPVSDDGGIPFDLLDHA
ncbi:hypothetical protein [Plantactinospora sp. DSM 117369]